jgi:tellurite resistance protein
LLAETVPDGTFGGARTLREQRRLGPDPDAARHLADLTAAVAEIDRDRGYGVNLRYRVPAGAA